MRMNTSFDAHDSYTCIIEACGCIAMYICVGKYALLIYTSNPQMWHETEPTYFTDVRSTHPGKFKFVS